MHWTVKVRDKRTAQEFDLGISIALTDPKAVQKHVEDSPGSHGGSHEGFEVLGVHETGKDLAPVAAAPASAVPETPGH